MSALASDPPFFKIGTTTACFMGVGNTVVASEALMIRTSRGERASMCCLTIDVGSGSSSHDFVADASTIFFTSEGDACSNNCWRVVSWQRRSILAHHFCLVFEISLEYGSECRG